MSRLRIALERYVGMCQGLRYKYHGPARRLSDFVTFMEARGVETITTALAMEWVTTKLVQTRLQVPEIVDLDRDSVILDRGAHVRCIGKGRKERSTPLTKVAQQALRCWLREPRRRGATALQTRSVVAKAKCAAGCR